MGQPEGPARPEDKRTIKFLLGRSDLGLLNYKGAHGPAREPARPEDKRTIKFLLGRFGVP